MEKDEREILEHSLGINGRRKQPYRNYYCVGVMSREYRLLCTMAGKGWVRAGKYLNDHEYRYFHVTEEGAAAIGTTLPLND